VPGDNQNGRHQLQYLDTRHVAALTGFSAKALEGMRHRGKGPRFLRIGRKIRYKLEDVINWMESNPSG
jgi:predicted DNA-binding transcriptional regulator AlpA